MHGASNLGPRQSPEYSRRPHADDSLEPSSWHPAEHHVDYGPPLHVYQLWTSQLGAQGLLYTRGEFCYKIHDIITCLSPLEEVDSKQCMFLGSVMLM